ncbi:hypothetical protein EJB05_55001, partial [Eragrostis curvula]
MIVGYFVPCFSPHVLVNMKTTGSRKFTCCFHYSSAMVVSMQRNSRHNITFFSLTDLIYTTIRRSKFSNEVFLGEILSNSFMLPAPNQSCSNAQGTN